MDGQGAVVQAAWRFGTALLVAAPMGVVLGAATHESAVGVFAGLVAFALANLMYSLGRLAGLEYQAAENKRRN